ncbi:glycosyltransferase family 2 protein [Gaetbulibacter sp. PBL-D1]|uniref:glycosyltransferase family 2 protein n=1 Tax=Gaetbulibacter sp. PBL-D1 TaxID=3422594 RepID=UPI003D2EE00C
MSKPKVTVCCITYNHEKYIAECLDGFLLQQTNFDVEFLIHDDASTDGTQNVILSKVGNDSRFQLILRKENIKSTGVPVFPILYKKAKGDYIALCEGDDYWTDPLKLQKQVDFLEANSDYVICFHNTQLYNDNKRTFLEDEITRKVPDTTTILDMAYGNYIHTPSVVFRNSFVLPDWFNQCVLGDWTLYMIIIEGGKVKKLNDLMCVYRVHESSLWSSKAKEYRYEKTLENVRVIKDNYSFTTPVKTILNQRLYKNIERKEYRGKYLIKKIKQFFEKYT